MPTDERVLVIPTDHFRSIGYFHGFRGSDEQYRAALLDRSTFSFRPRSEIESDTDFKQLIPYVVLICGSDVFHYRRGAAGTEKRLAAQLSVGIGGHISEVDVTGMDDPYVNGMHRELAEEVEIACPFTERFLGFINDDRTFVGRVHLGVVQLLELDEPAVTPREAAIADARFSPLPDLLPRLPAFETWSQFVLAHLAGGPPPV